MSDVRKIWTFKGDRTKKKNCRLIESTLKKYAKSLHLDIKECHCCLIGDGLKADVRKRVEIFND